MRLVPLAFNEQAQAWQNAQVAALVTYEPVRSQLRAQGAQVLFSSADVPGLIIDVLAVRADALPAHATALRALVFRFIKMFTFKSFGSRSSSTGSAPDERSFRRCL